MRLDPGDYAALALVVMFATGVYVLGWVHAIFPNYCT